MYVVDGKFGGRCYGVAWGVAQAVVGILGFSHAPKRLAQETNLINQHQACRTHRADRASHITRSGSFRKRKMAGLESSIQHLHDTVARL